MESLRAILSLYRELRDWRPPPDDKTEVEVFTSDPTKFPLLSKRLPHHSSPRSFVSLIATVKNEVPSIEEWFQSILTQTRLPDEVVIVDGGSTDGTYERLEALTRGSPVPVKLFREPGANIAAGRNRAIERARGPIVVCTDAGCVAPCNWLARITGPFAEDPSIEVVAGYYRAMEGSDLERAMAVFFCPSADRVHAESFLPSARSTAFLKCAWETAGGFPEWLTLTAEDTCFDLALRAHTRRWAFVPEAEVIWRLEPTLPRLFRQVRRYAWGSGEAGIYFDQYVAESIRLLGRLFAGGVLAGVCLILALSLRNWTMFGMALLAMGWLGRVLYRNTPRVHSARGFARVKLSILSAVVLCTIRLAMLIGFLEGARSRMKLAKKPGQSSTL